MAFSVSARVNGSTEGVLAVVVNNAVQQGTVWYRG
jgi:hypothetical protein